MSIRRLLLNAFWAAVLAPAWLSSGRCNVVNMSHYDSLNPDFNGIRKGGVGAVIHEATFPPGQMDERYAEREQDALRAGLLWGAYHFGDATDGVRQADHFLNFVAANWARGAGVTHEDGVLLILDFEKSHYPGGTMSIAQAVRFIERVHERTGVYPGFYSNEHGIGMLAKNPGMTAEARRILSRCWLWIANYHRTPQNCGIWSSWDLWQYTGDGVCELPRRQYPIGIANMRRAERNLLRGGATRLHSFWLEHAWHPDANGEGNNHPTAG